MRKPRSELKPRPAKRTPHKDIANLVTFYLHNIRMLDKSEYVGIIKQALLMMDKGITLSDISMALQNYAASQYIQSLPPQRRQHIRKFFKPENIRTWAKHPDEVVTNSDPSLAALARLNAAAPPRPPIEMPVWKIEEDEEDECPEL